MNFKFNIFVLTIFSQAVSFSSYAFAASEDKAVEIDGLPQLDFSSYSSQIFWMIMVFALLYIVLAKKTLPDISCTFENRKNHIQADLEAAEKIASEADSVHESYQASLTKAQEKAAKAVMDVENDMKKKSSDSFDEFRLRSEKEIKATEERINASKAEAMDEMNSIAAEAASVAVSKLIGKEANVSDVKEIIDGMKDEKARAA